MANGNFGGGDGTKENPFLIEDSYDLLAVAGGYDEDDYEEIEYDEGDDSNKKYYLQIKDIDLKDIPFKPILMSSSVYNGGGYKIKNLSVYDENREGGYFGLFSIIMNCVLTDIHIINAHIQIVENEYRNTSVYGILAAGAESSLIEKCSVSGTVESLVPDNGGVVGGGGLIGMLYSCTVNTSYADVSISSMIAGGLSYLAYDCVINDCYTKGSIRCLQGGTFVLSTGSTEIKNCYSVVNMLNVLINFPLRNMYEDIVITNCFINGDEFAFEWDETKIYYEGAIVRGTDGSFYRCFEYQSNRDFDVDLSTIPNFPIEWENVEDIEPYFPRFTRAQPVTGDLWATYWEQYNDDSISTTSLMKQKATFVDWDFTEIWGIKENETYPFFAEGRRIKCKSLNLPKKLIR